MAGIVILVTLLATTFAAAPAVLAQPAPAPDGGDHDRDHVPEFIMTPRAYGEAGTAVTSPPPFPARAGANDGSGEIRAIYSTRVPEAAKPAIQSALDRWSAALHIVVPVQVEVDWLSIGSDGLVGAARPSVAYADFRGAPRENTFYPVALANQITGIDQAPSGSDIDIIVADRSDWDYATAGTVSPDRISLATVVLHEVLHGLGFSTAFQVDASGIGRSIAPEASPTIFDRFVADRSGTLVSSLPNASPALGEALTGGLSWRGGQGTAANGGSAPALFSPSPFAPAASVAHLDEATYPTGHPDSISTPLIIGNEAIYSVGTIAPAMLADMGWVLEGQSASPAVPVPALPPIPVPASPPATVPVSAPLPLPGPSGSPGNGRPVVLPVETRVTTTDRGLEIGLRATVTSSGPPATIVAVTYSIDGAVGVPMTAGDGAFDGVSETATATVSNLSPGSHRICVTATDSSGEKSAPECATVTGAAAPVATSEAAPSSGPVPADTLPRTGFPTAEAAMLGALGVAGGGALVRRSRWSRPVSSWSGSWQRAAGGSPPGLRPPPSLPGRSG